MSTSVAELKEIMRSVVKEELEAQKPKESPAEHVLGCENCYPAVIKNARKNFNHQCSNCGLPLPDELVDTYDETSCPNCGGEDAEEIERE